MLKNFLGEIMKTVKNKLRDDYPLVFESIFRKMKLSYKNGILLCVIVLLILHPIFYFAFFPHKYLLTMLTLYFPGYVIGAAVFLWGLKKVRDAAVTELPRVKDYLSADAQKRAEKRLKMTFTLKYYIIVPLLFGLIAFIYLSRGLVGGEWRLWGDILAYNPASIVVAWFLVFEESFLVFVASMLGYFCIMSTAIVYLLAKNVYTERLDVLHEDKRCGLSPLVNLVFKISKIWLITVSIFIFQVVAITPIDLWISLALAASLAIAAITIFALLPLHNIILKVKSVELSGLYRRSSKIIKDTSKCLNHGTGKTMKNLAHKITLITFKKSELKQVSAWPVLSTWLTIMRNIVYFSLPIFAAVLSDVVRHAFLG